jgi:hypothetical protein
MLQMPEKTPHVYKREKIPYFVHEFENKTAFF